MGPDKIGGGGFQTTEAELKRFLPQPGAWELNGIRVRPGGKFVDHNAAGVANVEQLCNFVECLSRRVIPGSSQNLAAAFPVHPVKSRVAAGYDQADKRVLRNAAGKESSLHMPIQVIYRNQRLAESISHGFCGAQTDQQRSHKSRSLRNPKRVEFFPSNTCFFERDFDYRYNILQVLS